MTSQIFSILPTLVSVLFAVVGRGRRPGWTACRLRGAAHEPGESQLSDVKLSVGEVAVNVPRNVLPPSLRHHVHAHAALAHFGRIGAGDVAEFLEAAVVPVDAAVGALRAQVIETQTLDRLHRVARAAVLQRRLLEVARPADVARQRAAAAERRASCRES